MKFALVFQFPTDIPQALKKLKAVESQFKKALDETEAFVDGHDFGSGQMNIFVFCIDPKKTFAACKELVAANGLAEVMRAAYRRKGQDDYTSLWPADSVDEFVVK